MPPLAIPKQPSLPFQSYKDSIDNHRVLQGPPMVGFRTLDPNTVEAHIFELEAVRKLARVQALVRDSRHSSSSSFLDAAHLSQRELEQYLTMMKLRTRDTGSWSGVAVALWYSDRSLRWLD